MGMLPKGPHSDAHRAAYNKKWGLDPDGQRPLKPGNPALEKTAEGVGMVLGLVLLVGVCFIWHPMLWVVAFGLLFYTIKKSVAAGITEATSSAQKSDDQTNQNP